MKTFILCTAFTTLGLFGCSHSQQASRSSANELPYHQYFKHGQGTTMASSSDSQQASRSSANELPYHRYFKHGRGTTLAISSDSQQASCSSANEISYHQHFKHGHGPRTAPVDKASPRGESSNVEE